MSGKYEIAPPSLSEIMGGVLYPELSGSRLTREVPITARQARRTGQPFEAETNPEEEIDIPWGALLNLGVVGLPVALALAQAQEASAREGVDLTQTTEEKPPAAIITRDITEVPLARGQEQEGQTEGGEVEPEGEGATEAVNIQVAEGGAAAFGLTPEGERNETDFVWLPGGEEIEGEFLEIVWLPKPDDETIMEPWAKIKVVEDGQEKERLVLISEENAQLVDEEGNVVTPEEAAGEQAPAAERGEVIAESEAKLHTFIYGGTLEGGRYDGEYWSGLEANIDSRIPDGDIIAFSIKEVGKILPAEMLVSFYPEFFRQIFLEEDPQCAKAVSTVRWGRRGIGFPPGWRDNLVENTYLPRFDRNDPQTWDFVFLVQLKETVMLKADTDKKAAISEDDSEILGHQALEDGARKLADIREAQGHLERAKLLRQEADLAKEIRETKNWWYIGINLSNQ